MPGSPKFVRQAKGRMATSVDDIRSPLFWRAIAAELLGTAYLVLLGAGSCIGWDVDRDLPPSVLHIALTFGLAVATIVWGIAHVSGGHVNPAVTTGFLVTRKISLVRGLLFVVVQSLGGAVGAGILMAITPRPYRGLLGLTLPHPDINHGTALGIEFLITFVLVFTVFATCDEKRTDLKGSGPLAIGLSVTLCHLFAIRYTGASMNPARSFGVALVVNIWREHWVYWCGPLLGGIAAALLYDNVFASNASLEKAKGYLLASVYDPSKFAENIERPAAVIIEEDVPGSTNA